MEKGTTWSNSYVLSISWTRSNKKVRKSKKKIFQNSEFLMKQDTHGEPLEIIIHKKLDSMSNSKLKNRITADYQLVVEIQSVEDILPSTNKTLLCWIKTAGMAQVSAEKLPN